MRYFLLVICIIFVSWIWQAKAFTDIEYSWYKDSILELKEAWLVNWYWDWRFGPGSQITRAEILSIILRSKWVDIPKVWNVQCFPDVEPEKWYTDYICYAAANGITNGYEDGNFRPNGPVSIIEALAFTTWVFELKVEKDETNTEWYDDYRNYADEKKIIPKNSYTKDTLAKRGRVSDVIVRTKKLSQDETLNYRSKGCGATSSLQANNMINVNELNRSYLLELPKNYDASKEYPLIIGLHGRTNNNVMVKGYMWLMGGWRRWIEAHEVITAYPAWMWAWPFTWHQVQNIDFFDAMMQDIANNLCIDKSDVHIVGHSLGAYFSNKLSCLRWDVINSMTAVAWPGFNAECRGPTRSLILHNEADWLVAYQSWLNALKIRKEKNLCSDISEKITLGWLNCEIWNECSEWNSVVFCGWYPTYGNYPHSWPTQWAKWIYKFMEIEK